MPIPTPRNDEKRGDFMSRCISDLTKKGEFEDNKQRVAVCMNIFKDSESTASVEIGEGDDKKLFFTDAANENKTLNKPFRTPKGPKKFSVYVKNEKGNVVKVNFGDPNMEIKRDDPKRRKAFRSRHNCDNAGPKWKARYWSCKMWSKKSVTQITKGSEEYEWDGDSFFDHDDLLAINPSLVNAEEVSESAKRTGPKSGAQTPAEPSERRRGSKKNKKGSAGKKGGKITFSEKTTNALKEKVKQHNEKSSKKVTLGQLKRVYRRGAGAFSSSHRPNMSRHGWAMARVNTFLKMMRGGKVKESYRKADQDIAKAEYKGKKVYGMKMEDKEKLMFKSYMSHCMSNDAEITDTKDLDTDQSMVACAIQYKKDRATLMEENEGQLTEKQKSLPSWLQKEILKKQRGAKSEAAHGDKKKKYSYGSPNEQDHYFDTEEKAMKDAEKMGLKGIHTHKTEDGKTLYMAGPNHEAFMKRHKEILKEKGKSDSSLWENIRKKRERIKRGSGEKMRKKGEKGAPTEDQVKRAKGGEG